MVHSVAGEAQERAQLSLHESMALWLSIQRVGVRAEAQERSPVPPRASSEDLTDLDAVEDSPADGCSQSSPAHGQDDGDSDSDEHGGSDSSEGGSDSSEKKALDGATSLVAMFGTGWLSSKVFNVLYTRVAKRPVYLDTASLTAVNNFKRALCKMRGKDAYDWNRNLSANLEQLAAVRQLLAEHHETLSGDAEVRWCLWKWVYDYKFTPAQRDLGRRHQRSIFSTILHRELGCKDRAHEVVKIGANGLANDIIAEGEEEVLARFIAYICRIEKAVDENTQRGRDLDSRPRTGRGDAQERAHSPHDKGTTTNSKGPPLIRAYVQPAKGKGKGANENTQRGRDLDSRQRTGRGGAQERAHSAHDEDTKTNSKGAPLIRAYVQPAKGKGKGAKNKHGTPDRGCRHVRRAPWENDDTKKKRGRRDDFVQW